MTPSIQNGNYELYVHYVTLTSIDIVFIQSLEWDSCRSVNSLNPYP